MNANGPTTSFLRDDGAPDWDAISFDVCCSRCGYNLRTLTRPLCPECGLTFEWPEVLDRSAFRSDSLFEHNWRTRPFKSFVLTVWRSLRPRAFWTRISIHDHIDLRLPLLFPFLAAFAFPVFFHGTSFLAALIYEWMHGPIVPSWNAIPFRPVKSLTLSESMNDAFYFLKDIGSLPFQAPRNYFLILPLTLLFFVVSGALLCAMRQTLGKCKVRSIHIVRVICYSSLPVSIYAALAVVLSTFLQGAAGERGAMGMIVSLCFLFLPLIAIPTYFYKAGLKHYLKLPHSTALAVAATLVGLGTLINMILIL